MSYAPASGGSRRLLVTSGQALLKLSPDAVPAALDGALAALGARRGSELGSGWLLVSWEGAPVSRQLPLFRALPGVLAADPSRVYRPNLVPSDSLAASQYALAQVDAFGAWDYEVGTSSRVTIAVVDSGIDATHPDLSAKLTGTSMNFNPNTGAASVNHPPTPACNHATHVAGIAAAVSDNALQVAGMSWGAGLLSLRVFDPATCDVNCCSPAGDCSLLGDTCLTNDPGIIAALNYATGVVNTAAYGRIVVNLSVGGPGACSSALQDAIGVSTSVGIIVVAAAGNDGSDVNNPGNCAGAIPMGATNQSNQVASFSSRGPELAANGLVAPGVAVLTTDLSSRTTSATGTSFSSPMGAGLAALILSAKPSAAWSQVKTFMRAGAEDIGESSSAQGAGRMNAQRSLRLAVKGTLAGFDGVERPIAFPNPFRVTRHGRVNFSIPPSIQGGRETIKVYTQDGMFVRELSGLVWDGKNADGSFVASGSYLFVVSSGKGTARGRFAVIR